MKKIKFFIIGTAAILLLSSCCVREQMKYEEEYWHYKRERLKLQYMHLLANTKSFLELERDIRKLDSTIIAYDTIDVKIH